MVEKIRGKKVVGIKQTTKCIKDGKAAAVYLAKDAEVKFIQPIEELCKANNIELIYVNSMSELGHMCGIDVGAAAAALLN